MPALSAAANFPVLLLAAGGSTRMRGRDKLLEHVHGRPLLRERVETVLAAGLLPFVMVPGRTDPRADSICDLDVRNVPVPDRDEGMAASIRAGAEIISDTAAGAMVLPADMPEITAGDMLSVLAKFLAKPEKIVRGATAANVGGHPVIFPARLIPRLRNITGDTGARDLLRGEDIVLVPLPGNHAVCDLDTPEDWTAWRGVSRP